ncbi:MAG: murein biosynthesis integral membrane protein MurJ [Actinomycetales bacterium]|nr:murein biosynthesis integral membrane protein MurJ [Actinomycetales bacterium]
MSAKSASIASSSLAMAAGSVASRVLGVIRQSLIVVAIGQGITANTFTTANTLPNIIYMIIAGGVLNSVLVPQLVKAAKAPDGGRAYTDRLLTVGLGALLLVTVVSTLLAGWLVRLYAINLQGSALELATFFAVITLPQIFFYGLYGLLGQVLNARGQFAAFGWSPALANVVAISGLLAFMRLYQGHLTPGEWTPAMVWWFAGTATLSIAAQALILLIPLWRGGFRFTPRFDLRGVGLASTSRIAGWAFAALLVSQLSYLVVSQVLWHASGSDPAGRRPGEPFVAGVTVWANALFVFMVPHALVALSVITAMYPRISAAVHARDNAALRRDYAQGLAFPAVLTIPAGAVLIILARPITSLLFTAKDPDELPATALALAILAIGIVPFGVDVLNQRYFYAMEKGRLAMAEQIVLTASSVGIALVGLWVEPTSAIAVVAIGLVVSNVLAAAFGMWQLRRRIGDYGLRPVLIAWGRMVLAAAGAGYLAWGLVVVLTRALAARGRLGDAVTIVLAGTLFAVVYFLLARMLQIRELERLVVPVINRLDRRPAGRHRGELAGDAPSPATQAEPPTSGDAPPPHSLPSG